MPLSEGVHFFTPSLPVHVFQAAEPGPTALIQGGIHGDEIAGVHALYELLEEGLRPTRGRLIVVPVMNPPAFRARRRCAPGGLDLNRCFPSEADDPAPERRLAHRFMELVLDERPALMATLHESTKRYDPAVRATFGQTLIYGVEPMPPLVAQTVARLNERFPGPETRWAPHYYPVATSSTEVIVETLAQRGCACVGICVETWMGFAERFRVEMQRAVVELLLDGIGVRSLS